MDSKSPSKQSHLSSTNQAITPDINNPETDNLDGQDTSSLAYSLQKQIDKKTIKYARNELKIDDESLLSGRMSDALINTINEVKLKHRTSTHNYTLLSFSITSSNIIDITLNDWVKDNYYKRQGEVCDRILKGEDPSFKDSIERIHVDDLSFEEFIEKYERGSRPVIIQGVVDSWPAKHNWTVKVRSTMRVIMTHDIELAKKV